MKEIDSDQGAYLLLLRCLEVAARDARAGGSPYMRREAAGFLWDFAPEYAQREHVPQVTDRRMTGVAT